jgi:hypothetical protein
MTLSSAQLTGVRRHTGRAVKDVGLSDIFDFLVLLLAVTVIAWEIWSLDAERPEMRVYGILLGFNGYASFIGIWISLRRGFPTLLASFYFSYFFLSVAPLQQIRVRFDPIFSHDSILLTTILLCLMLTGIAFTALYFRARPVRRVSGPRGFLSRSSYDRNFHPLALFSAVAAVSVGLLLLYGPALISTRETSTTAVLEHFDKIGLVFVTACLNAFVFIGAVIGVLAARFNNNRPWLVAFLFLLVIAEFINNPMVTARFRASELIVFALLAFFGWRNTRLLLAFLLTGVLASPLLNVFRTEAISDPERRTFETFFAHIDFDAFAMTSYAIHHVGQAAYGYGSNLLATLLFFVPRAIWTEKGQQVGPLVWPQVRYYRSVGTDVLASPPIAEGFYDYGFVGAFLLTSAIFTAFVMLERRAEAAERASPLRLLVCLSPMLAILIMRGTLIVGYSEFWGNFAALTAAVALARVKMRWSPAMTTRAN